MNFFRLVGALLGAAAWIAAAPLVAQPPSASAPAAARIPIEALAQPAFLAWPTLSPDGNRVAARLKVDGRDWIGVWDLRDPPGTQPHMWPQSDYELRWLRWAGPNRLMLGAQLQRTTEGVEFTVTRIVSLDVASGQAVPLDTGRGILGDDVIFVDPEGAYILVSAQSAAVEYPDVLRVDLATGRSTIVEHSRE